MDRKRHSQDSSDTRGDRRSSTAGRLRMLDSMLPQPPLRPQRPMHPAPDAVPGCIAHELRDGLLQDLLAVSMLIEGARRDLRLSTQDEMPEGQQAAAEQLEAMLARAATTIEADIEAVRSAIDRLRQSAYRSA